MYNVIDIANYIINHYSISNLKLQKILYFVQAEFLVNKNEPCFEEEIEAWDFGPVIPKVYRKYSIYGASIIPNHKKRQEPFIIKEDKERIDSIVKECISYSSPYLVELTQKQTPWIRAYQPHQSNIISKISIRDFFSED